MARVKAAARGVNVQAGLTPAQLLAREYAHRASEEIGEQAVRLTLDIQLHEAAIKDLSAIVASRRRQLAQAKENIEALEQLMTRR